MTTSERSKLVALGHLRGAIRKAPPMGRTSATLRSLTRSLRDSSVEVSDLAAAAIEDLGGAGKPLIPALVRVLRRRPRYAVGEAIIAVGVAAVPTLVKLLADPSRKVRRIAAWSLGSPKLAKELQTYGASGARSRVSASRSRFRY